MSEMQSETLAQADSAPNVTALKKRLAIVVPYRDRAEHLSHFVPHMLAYFSRDKLDRHIPYTIHIVEQAGKEPFNRGKLKNIGFRLAAENADYVCFHDVDYLPIWADYSYSPRAARLVWHGLVLRENYDEFFGAVVMFDREVFECINGFSNGYLGWGFEDTELRLRLMLAGLDFERRDGTYTALPHAHSGLRADGSISREAERNRDRFQKRITQLAQLVPKDGLSNLKYSLVHTQNLVLGGTPLENVFHHLVRV